MVQPWMVALLAIAVGQLVATVLLYHWLGDGFSESAAEDVAPPESTPSEVPEDAVRCPRCGTPNAPGYRFCHNCIGELPGWNVRHRGGGGPDAGGV